MTANFSKKVQKIIHCDFIEKLSKGTVLFDNKNSGPVFETAIGLYYYYLNTSSVIPGFVPGLMLFTLSSLP